MVTWLIWAAVILGIGSVITRHVLNAPVGLVGATSYRDAIRQGRRLEAMMRFLFQFAQGLVWFFENILYWVYRPIRLMVVWVFKKYMRLWRWATIDSRGYSSYPRKGLMVTATILVLALFEPVAVGTGKFVGDAALYGITNDRETVYLTFSQEIDPANDIHSVKGCYTLPCTEENAVYYRVRPVLFHHVWSLLHRGQLFYPDYVAAAVPAVVSRCEVLNYGFRQKALMKQADWYLDMLDAKCTPINNG